MPQPVSWGNVHGDCQGAYDAKPTFLASLQLFVVMLVPLAMNGTRTAWCYGTILYGRA